MKKMESESIDLMVTSPPYDNLRTYNWKLNWNFEIFKEIAKECARIIKKMMSYSVGSMRCHN